MKKRMTWTPCLAFLALTVTLLCGVPLIAQTATEEAPKMRIHYVEIVAKDADQQRAALEQLHGVTFGPEVADLGNARVAEAANGVRFAVRAPLAEHEQPVVRTYIEVDDIERAVKEAEAAGAMIAYPPTQQGDTGTWAVYFLGGNQFGFWQR